MFGGFSFGYKKDFQNTYKCGTIRMLYINLENEEKGIIT